MSDGLVKWSGAKPGTWSGEGIARVTKMDAKRMHFGPKMGQPGPALELTLVHNGMTVWVKPDEVVPA